MEPKRPAATAATGGGGMAAAAASSSRATRAPPNGVARSWQAGDAHAPLGVAATALSAFAAAAAADGPASEAEAETGLKAAAAAMAAGVDTQAEVEHLRGAAKEEAPAATGRGVARQRRPPALVVGPHPAPASPAAQLRTCAPASTSTDTEIRTADGTGVGRGSESRGSESHGRLTGCRAEMLLDVRSAGEALHGSGWQEGQEHGEERSHDGERDADIQEQQQQQNLEEQQAQAQEQQEGEEEAQHVAQQVEQGQEQEQQEMQQDWGQQRQQNQGKGALPVEQAGRRLAAPEDGGTRVSADECTAEAAAAAAAWQLLQQQPALQPPQHVRCCGAAEDEVPGSPAVRAGPDTWGNVPESLVGGGGGGDVEVLELLATPPIAEGPREPPQCPTSAAASQAPTAASTQQLVAAAAPAPAPTPTAVTATAAASLEPPSVPPPSLFDVLRVLPAHIVAGNLLSRIGPRETCALRLLSREWDAQVRNEWCVSLRLGLSADCVRKLRARVERGSQHTLAARHSAATRLQLIHRRLDRTIFPNTLVTGSSGLLEMPPVVVDDAPPLPEVLHTAAAPFGRRLRRLHLSSESAAVSELELELISVMVPELRELVLRFDCCERPAPALGALASLGRLRRLGLLVANSKLNYDPALERLVSSLDCLTGLRSLSLELTASSLPLPGRCLARLTSLRLAVVFKGYSAGQQSEQLRGLVSQLGHLTELRALAVPDGYRGSDGDLLRAASRVLPSLTALHMPRLSATRPELEALARLPLLQEVTLGSLDIAPDEDYDDLLPFGFYADDTSRTLRNPLARPPPPPPLLLDAAAATAADPGTERSDPYNAFDLTSHWRGGLADDCSAGSSSCRPPKQTTSPWGRTAANPGGDGGNGVGSGMLQPMASWRRLVLCEEQRMEALVAAGPLPTGLRELRVEQLLWPRGSRADVLTARGVAAIHALCADMARLPAVAVHLSLESLTGAATATFHDVGSDGPDAGDAAAAAAAAGGRAASSGGGGGDGRAAERRTAGSWGGCGSVREVVTTACAALGRITGLRTLRWAGLLPLLAHLDPRGVAEALGSLPQVSELEISTGLYGAHPASSPLFLLHLARGLEALPRLRRLGLACTAPQNDALAQGLPGLLVALRRPLLVEASFLTREDAAALRALIEGTTAGGAAAASGVTVVAWDDGYGGGRGVAAQQGAGVAGGPMGREAQCCHGGWRWGGGLWWQAEDEEEEEEDLLR